LSKGVVGIWLALETGRRWAAHPVGDNGCGYICVRG